MGQRNHLDIVVNMYIKILINKTNPEQTHNRKIIIYFYFWDMEFKCFLCINGIFFILENSRGVKNLQQATYHI